MEWVVQSWGEDFRWLGVSFRNVIDEALLHCGQGFLQCLMY